MQFLGKISNHLGHSAPLQPRFGTLWLLVLPKWKSPLKGKRLQTINEIQENITGHLMAIERTVWGLKVPALKGTEASLFNVQCFLYIVSSSINVSIFHVTWLDTSWTDFLYQGNRIKNPEIDSHKHLTHLFKNFYSIKDVPIFSHLPSSDPPTHHSHNFHTVVHVHRWSIHVLSLVPSPSFHHYLPPHCSLVTVSLYHVSRPVVVFSSLVILFIRFFL